MLTKNDLSQIKAVVKETIQPEIAALKKSAKKDMENLEVRLTSDIKGLRDDMKSLEKKLIEKIDEAQMEIIATVDKHKADNGKVDNLEKRVERLEDNSGLPPYVDQ